jgi:hypothetical protein
VINKGAQKILKHKELTRQENCMWNVNIKVITVTIGGTGNSSENTSATYRDSTKSRSCRK